MGRSLRTALAAFGVCVFIASAEDVFAQETQPRMQQPETAASRKEKKDQKWSTLKGMVIDSVHLLPLAQATVLLDGTTLSATTNDDGQFQIDSIPPGDYRIAVFHPLLDTLGFSIGTEPLRMGADSVREVWIGTPSSKSIVLKECPATKRRLGEAAVMGRVVDPDTELPLAGVRVSIVWTKLEVGRTIGLRRTPQMREATTDSSGTYVICGVSPDIQATIQAERGESKTPEVNVELIGEELLAFRDLRMSDVPLSDSAPTTGEAILFGRVTNKNGAPIGDVRVSVQGTSISMTTAPNGTYRLVGLPSGTRLALFMKVGFSAKQRAVDLSSANPTEINIMMDEAPPMLEAVEVAGKYEKALKKNGFLDRKRMGMGRYLGPKDIERRQPQYLSSLFQTIPGFRVEAGFGGNAIKSTRGSNGCVTVWVDGIQYRESQAGELDNQILPEQLMAIETYSPVAAPSEFKAAGQTDCSVIVIWTNRTVRE